jgi:hypothetical protein
MQHGGISRGVGRMKRGRFLLGAIVVLALLVTCGSEGSLSGPTPSSPSTAPVVTAALPAATLLPSHSPTPRPTATWVPTLTSLPSPPTVTPSPQPRLEPDSSEADLQAQMDAIEVEVAFLRGLEEGQPLTRTVITRDELAAYLEAKFEEEYSPEELEDDVRVLAALDFVPADFDLRSLLFDLYSGQVIGLYDDEEELLYVVSEASERQLDLLARVTFAHEYTHGLQDGRFDLETFVDEDRLNDDEILARTALVEGDASLLMSQYLMAHLREISAEDLAALQDEDIQAQKDLEAAPAIIRETFTFPYFRGLEFVQVLHGGSWDAVDAAYADPPQSTEQILHPDKYLSRDEPQILSLPPLTDTLGGGWRLVEEETLGEFRMGLYLARQVDTVTAERASQGWDGDRYALYAQNGGQVLVLKTVWDSAEDREEFMIAYQQVANVKFGGPPARSGEIEVWWQTPDQAAVLARGAIETLVVLGPDLATVEKVLAAIR